jgi:hypothetical protein
VRVDQIVCLLLGKSEKRSTASADRQHNDASPTACSTSLLDSTGSPGRASVRQPPPRKFDAPIERVQVDIGGITARLAILRHQVPQLSQISGTSLSSSFPNATLCCGPQTRPPYLPFGSG